VLNNLEHYKELSNNLMTSTEENNEHIIKSMKETRLPEPVLTLLKTLDSYVLDL